MADSCLKFVSIFLLTPLETILEGKFLEFLFFVLTVKCLCSLLYPIRADLCTALWYFTNFSYHYTVC